MPVYEYKCEECGKRIEKLSRFNEPPPTCCEDKMKKLVSRTSFTLKGDGWAKDGYSNKGN